MNLYPYPPWRDVPKTVINDDMIKRQLESREKKLQFLEELKTLLDKYQVKIEPFNHAAVFVTNESGEDFDCLGVSFAFDDGIDVEIEGDIDVCILGAKIDRLRRSAK